MQYAATAQYSDGSSEDVTSRAVWWTVYPSILRSDGAGVFSAGKPGEAHVHGALGQKLHFFNVLVLPPGTFKLQGAVTESGGNRLDGAFIEIVSGTGTGARAETRNGSYTLYGAGGIVRLRAFADGFTSDIRDVDVTSHEMHESFVLTRVTPPANLSGLWTMTLSASAACRDVPERALPRTYRAEVAQQDLQLKVAISSPTLRGVFTNLPGSVLGWQVRFSIHGDTTYIDPVWTSPSFVDVVSDTETFGFMGDVGGMLHGAEIRAQLSGDLLYWDARRPSFAPNWLCTADDHVVTLRR